MKNLDLHNGNEIKGGVLIVGSLLWENEKNAINKEQGKLRTKWRTKLDLESKIAVDVPIRYGRRSGSRRCTYTMVFSNSSELGKAYIVPYKDGISSFAELKTQAIELAYAEGISSHKYPDRLFASWGAVGIAFNKIRGEKLNEIVKNWNKEFEVFKGSKSFKLGDEKPTILNNGEFNFNLDIPEHIDYVFATPMVPNISKYPSINEVVEAIIKSRPQYDTYLINNYKNGIRVKNDEKMLEKLKKQ